MSGRIIGKSISISTVYDGQDGAPGAPGADGVSPWLATLDNEMDSVSTDESGYVSVAQTVTTNISLFQGSTAKSFKITSVLRNGSSSLGTGVTVSPAASSTTRTTPTAFTVTYGTTSKITSFRDDFSITIQAVDDSTVTRTLHLTVTAVVGDVYNILSDFGDGIHAQKNAQGQYVVNGSTSYTLVCGYTKRVGNTITETVTSCTDGIVKSGDYQLYYTRRVRSTGEWELYNGTSPLHHRLNSGTTTVNINTYDAIKIYIFRGLTNTKKDYAASSPDFIDMQTVYVVSDGADGESGADSVRVDLSNDADIIACDSTGKVRFERTVTTTARIFVGASSVTTGVTAPTAANTRLAGITPTISTDGGAVTISWTFPSSVTMANASYSCDITLTYDDTSYTATFTLTKSDTAAIYQLHPSKTEIVFSVNSSNAYTPSSDSVSCTYVKHESSGTTIGTTAGNFGGYYIWYRRLNTSGSTVDANGNTISSGSQNWWPAWKSTGNTPIAVSVNASKDIASVEFVISTVSSSSSWSSVASSNITDRETIPVLRAGKNGSDGQGQPGHVGRFFYFAGDYNSSTTYYFTKSQAPYVRYNGSFYMLDFAASPEIQQSDATQSVTNKSPGTYGSGNPWTLMASEQQYYIAKAYFGDKAEFGSGIINEDWMMSKKGGIATVVRNAAVTATSSSAVAGWPKFTLKGGLVHSLVIKGTVTGGTMYVTVGGTTVSFTSTSGESKSVTLEPSSDTSYTPMAYITSGYTGNIDEVSITEAGMVDGTDFTDLMYLYFDPEYPNGEKVVKRNTSYTNRTKNFSMTKDVCYAFTLDLTVDGGRNVNLYIGNSSVTLGSVQSSGKYTFYYSPSSTASNYQIRVTASDSVINSTVMSKFPTYVPAWAVDMKNGYTYQSNGYFKGRVIATDGEFSGVIHASGGEFSGTLSVRGENKYTKIGPGVFEIGAYQDNGTEETSYRVSLKVVNDKNYAVIEFLENGKVIGQIDASLFADRTDVADTWTPAYYYMIGEGGSRPVYPPFEAVSTQAGTRYYQYNEGWTKSGGVITYHDSNASQPGVKDGKWFKSMDKANTNVMPAGWYVDCRVKSSVITASDGTKWRQYYMDVWQAITTTTGSGTSAKTYTALTKDGTSILGPLEPTGITPAE